MQSPILAVRLTCLMVGVSMLGTLVGACNKQPNPSATEAPMVAPPVAALPMATSASAPVGLAPEASALPAPTTHVAYTPPPAGQRYAYIDRAYGMREAFAGTPPDYAVDYEGTRPWIWRAQNGAYRIVERLPRGERDYYYEPGQEYPFLVQDPDYSYAYDSGGLAAVYGPNGAELPDALAARLADQAARYRDRSRQLYRVAQYQQRQSPYASEWAKRRDDLRARDAMWQHGEADNPDWRSWHQAHAAEEQQQWRQERDQRAAYAAAIGIAVAAATSGQPARAAPNPAELARRQAGYFSNWRASHGLELAKSASEKRPSTGSSAAQIAAPAAQIPNIAAHEKQAADAQARAAQAKLARANLAEIEAADLQRRQSAAAQANLAQAQRAQQLAAEAKQREAAAARTRAAEATNARQLALAAQKGRAAEAQAKAPEAKIAAAKAARTKAAEANAARAKAADAQRAEQRAAQLKQHDAEVSQAKAAEAKAAEAKADHAKAAEAKAAEAKAADTQHAQEAAHAEKVKPAGKPAAKAQKKPGPKDQQSDQPK